MYFSNDLKMLVPENFRIPRLAPDYFVSYYQQNLKYFKQTSIVAMWDNASGELNLEFESGMLKIKSYYEPL